MSDEIRDLSIGILGGTGPLGRGLATRWARAGLRVVVGSRDADRAAKTANEIVEQSGADDVSGLGNADCAAAADLVVVAVPYDGHKSLLETIGGAVDGKIVVDVVNPLGFDKRGPYRIDLPEGSAAEEAEQALPGARMTAAFHHVSAVLLNDLDQPDIPLDVLVLGDDREATDVVRALADAIPGMRGVYGGRLRNAGQVEALTANLIAINRRYKAHAGLRITGL